MKINNYSKLLNLVKTNKVNLMVKFKNRKILY